MPKVGRSAGGAAGSLCRWLRTGAVAVGLGVPAIVALTLHGQRTQDLADAELRVTNTARALEQHAARTFEVIDTYLRAVVAFVGTRAGDLPPGSVQAALRDQLARSHLTNITVFATDGTSLATAVEFPTRPRDVRDSDYFQALRDHPDGRLAVGSPFVGRLTGKLLLPVARRIDNPDGSFGGIVQALLDTGTFQAVYDSIDNGPGAALTLWRSDGTLLVRAPNLPGIIGRNFADSESYRRHVPASDRTPFWAPALTDGVERVIALGYLDGYPMHVGAAISRDDALADWRRSAVTQAAVAGGLTLVLVAALLLLAREVRRRQDADAQIRASEASYRLLADNATDMVIRRSVSDARTYVSPSAQELLGYEPAEVLTKPLQAVVHPDDIEATLRMLGDLREGRSDQGRSTLRNRHKDGRWIWVDARFRLVRDETGAPCEIIVAVRDISERVAAEEALRESQERLSLALDSGSDGLWDWNVATGAVTFSGPYLQALGHAPGENTSDLPSLLQIIHPDDLDAFMDSLNACLEGRTEVHEAEYRKRLKDGSFCWTMVRGKAVSRDGAGRALRMVGTYIDITARKEAERQITHMALHDSLTGLANRALFYDRLRHALADARGQGETFAVLACDLDRFKDVNDTHGHPAGDRLLRVVADRLRAIVRDGDTVARLGGDEFAILLRRLDGPQTAALMAQRVIEATSEPIDLGCALVGVGVSVGIAFAAAGFEDADSLFKNADIALYRAKTGGRNTYSFYEPGMDAVIAERNRLEGDLREAVRNGGFTLHYQPIVRLDDDAVGGFEALMRWPHETRGMVSPAEFIPLAEETGLIVPLGEWALREACREAVDWPGDVRVAVNVSPVQFRRPGLEQAVVGALAASGLAPGRLELEITESVLMDDSEAAIACLHRLRALGVRIALDDFGTGFSSLSYLRQFPFQKIKIDRSFVREIHNPDTAAIVRAVVGIGARLGATITAEGVETGEQLACVREVGCSEVQGYLFGKPMPAVEAVVFTRAGRGRAAA